MHELKPISYEESRLEYFREQKAHCERCLNYWVKAMRRGKCGSSQMKIEDKCGEDGEHINCYEDGVIALGGERKM